MFGMMGFPPMQPTDYISVEIGVCPTDEQSPCPGFARYEEKVLPSMDRWEKLLMGLFPGIREYGKLSRHRKNSEYGPEWNVIFEYRMSNKQAVQFAIFLTDNLPSKWVSDSVEIVFLPKSDEQLVSNELDLELEEWMEENNFGDNGGYPFLPGSGSIGP